MDPVSVHKNYKTTWDLLMWSNFYLGVQSLKPVLSCSWFWKEPSVSVLFALIQPLLWFLVCFLWFHRTFSALFQNPKYITTNSSNSFVGGSLYLWMLEVRNLKVLHALGLVITSSDPANLILKKLDSNTKKPKQKDDDTKLAHY